MTGHGNGAHHARNVDGIGRGDLDGADLLLRAGDFDDGWIVLELRLISARHFADDTGLHRNRAFRTGIEGNMNLAGDDLRDGKAIGDVDLVSEVEGTLAGFNVGDINLGADFGGLQAADDGFRTANANLRARNILGTDLQIRGHIAKDDGHVQCHL